MNLAREHRPGAATGSTTVPGRRLVVTSAGRREALLATTAATTLMASGKGEMLEVMRQSKAALLLPVVEEEARSRPRQRRRLPNAAARLASATTLGCLLPHALAPPIHLRQPRRAVAPSHSRFTTSSRSKRASPARCRSFAARSCALSTWRPSDPYRTSTIPVCGR